MSSLTQIFEPRRLILCTFYTYTFVSLYPLGIGFVSRIPKMPKSMDAKVPCIIMTWYSWQSTSREMPGWMKHKLGLRLSGEISII